MNNERRKSISIAHALIVRAKSILEDAAAEEQEYFDNMPESFQYGEKGDAAQEAADNLDNAHGELEGIESYLEDYLVTVTDKETRDAV